MTPPEDAKSYGLKTLSAGAKFHGIHPDTLTGWHKTRPALFKAACERAAAALNGDVDYRELLIKYIRMMHYRNGVTLLETSTQSHRFTDQEWKILQNIANISQE